MLCSGPGTPPHPAKALAPSTARSDETEAPHTPRAGFQAYERTGYMMHCNGNTRDICHDLGILAGPRSLFSEMQEHIGPNTTIILYDVSTRCLHGIFQPTSRPEMNIAPEAFQGR